MRKFQILDITLNPGGPGPNRCWIIHYRAIVKKVWVEKTLTMIAKTKEEARHKAEQMFG